MSTSAVPTVWLVTNLDRVSPSAHPADPGGDAQAILERLVVDALEGGVDGVLLREPHLTGRQLFELAGLLLRHTRAHGARLIVHGRADVAAVTHADGLHLPAGVPGASHWRPLLPPHALVGQSAHDPGEVARHDGADYVFFGTMFAGGTKARPQAPQTIEDLRHAVAQSPAPIVAIGGMTPARAGECFTAGAHGVAAITAFLPAGQSALALGAGAAARAFRSMYARRPRRAGDAPATAPEEIG